MVSVLLVDCSRRQSYATDGLAEFWSQGYNWQMQLWDRLLTSFLILSVGHQHGSRWTCWHYVIWFMLLDEAIARWVVGNCHLNQTGASDLWCVNMNLFMNLFSCLIFFYRHRFQRLNSGIPTLSIQVSTSRFLLVALNCTNMPTSLLLQLCQWHHVRVAPAHCLLNIVKCFTCLNMKFGCRLSYAEQ